MLSYVPKEFVQFFKPFFDHTSMIEAFWKGIFLDIRSAMTTPDAEW